ncbi:hypothetical protein [Pseudomarimonas arenosa]|uniref:Uncharacterized protein n=1 Tax=Pseudomarimonas arenosa TaxID=2774145 RepID=A0AAW3ZDX7_9GAMM|nr:hypothetical protein [Pseudomarimonas arenosa]MBD8524428.1 hypothetical protein [Pseudomarimonas arenosa]
MGLREVHYDGGKIAAWRLREARPSGESFAELRRNLQRMTEALQKSVLEERQMDGKSTPVETEHQPHQPRL